MICDLGLTDYDAAYRVQRDLVARRRLGEIEDSLIVTEHRPVFTIGRAGDRRNLLVDDAVLSRSGIRLIRVDRGGDITCHAPGQLMAYPILDLAKRGKDLHKYLRDLEEVGIRILARCGVEACRIEGKTGVWVGKKKIVSIGVGSTNWITYHGMGINIKNDLHYYAMMNPCGMTDAPAISLEAHLGRSVDLQDVKIILMREFFRIFRISNGMFAH